MTLLWKPLLASSLPMDPDTGDFRWDLIVFPVWASPKLDGYRTMVQRGVLTSRGGLAVANRELQRRYGRKDLEGLDGELCTGRPTAANVFNATSRVVRKAEADASTTALYAIDTFTGQSDFAWNLQVNDAESDRIGRAAHIDFLAAHINVAARGLQRARQHLDQRRLTRPIVAEQSDDIAP